MSVPAQAALPYVLTADLVASSNELVEGTVLSTEVKKKASGRVYTEVVLEVHSNIKGKTNEGSNLTFTVSGGTLNGINVSISELPTFKVGEDVVLYLRDIEPFGYIMNTGIRGKVSEFTDPDTGEKYIRGGSDAVQVSLKEDIQALKKAAADAGDEKTLKALEKGQIPTKLYVKYLRNIVREQKKTQ